MFFQGSLKSFPIVDLVAFLLHQRKTGVLTVVNRDTEREFLFSGGNLMYATTQDEWKRLGTYLLHLGCLNHQQLEQVLGSSFRRDRFIGQRVLELGHVSKEMLDTAVHTQIFDLLEEVMGWDGGAFHFDEMPMPFKFPGMAAISSQRMLLEITSRRDQVARAREIFQDYVSVYALREALDVSQLDGETAHIVGLIDGMRTIQQIIVESRLQPEVSATILKDMVQVGMITRRSISVRRSLRPPVPELKSVPVSLSVAASLFQILDLEDPARRLSELQSVLSREPLLTAKLLKMLTLSNVQIGPADLSLVRFAQLLGDFQLRCALTPEAVRGFFFPQREWVWQDLWTHTEQCALICRKLALRTGYIRPDEAFVAGLIHNLGAFLLLHHSPKKYSELLLKSTRERVPVEDLEEATFGISHTKLGSRYAEKWNFPMSLRIVIKHHHAVSTHFQNPILDMLGVANVVLQFKGLKVGYMSEAEQLLRTSLRRLDLELPDAEAVCRETRRELEAETQKGHSRGAGLTSRPEFRARLVGQATEPREPALELV